MKNILAVLFLSLLSTPVRGEEIDDMVPIVADKYRLYSALHPGATIGRPNPKLILASYDFEPLHVRMDPRLGPQTDFHATLHLDGAAMRFSCDGKMVAVPSRRGFKVCRESGTGDTKLHLSWPVGAYRATIMFRSLPLLPAQTLAMAGAAAAWMERVVAKTATADELAAQRAGFAAAQQEALSAWKVRRKR